LMRKTWKAISEPQVPNKAIIRQRTTHHAATTFKETFHHFRHRYRGSRPLHYRERAWMERLCLPWEMKMTSQMMTTTMAMARAAGWPQSTTKPPLHEFVFILDILDILSNYPSDGFFAYHSRCRHNALSPLVTSTHEDESALDECSFSPGGHRVLLSVCGACVERKEGCHVHLLERPRHLRFLRACLLRSLC